MAYQAPSWKANDKLFATEVNDLAKAVEGKAEASSVSSAVSAAQAASEAVAGKADKADLTAIENKRGGITATGKRVVFGKEQPVGIIVGSSSVFGSGAPEGVRPVARFARRLERKIQRTWGVPEDRAPFTMIAGDPNSPYVDGGSALQGGLGKFSRIVKDGETISFTSPYPSTGIWVGFREGSSVGNVTMSVNGGNTVDVPVGKSGASKWTGQYKSPEVDRGMNTYTFTVSGGSQVFDFVHFYDETNTAGPIALNAGWGESTLQSLMDTQSTTDRIKSINPDFLIILMGSNDQGAGTSREDFQAAMAQCEQIIRDNTTGPTWVMYMSQARPGVTDFDRTVVIDPMRAVADGNPGFRSFSPALEDFWTNNADDRNVLGTLHTDNVHPSVIGHAAIADWIGEVLGLAGGRGTVPSNITDGVGDPAPVEFPEAPVSPFTVWTSDTFDAGELAGRSTDAVNGGNPQPYDTSGAKESTVADGSLNLSTSSSAVFLTPGSNDVEVDFSIKSMTGNQAWVRARVAAKAASPRDCLGLRVTRTGDAGANLQIDQKVDGTTSMLSTASVPVQFGQVVMLRAVGDQATLLVDGEEKQTVTTTSTGGDHMQMLGYNAAVSIDNLTVRTIL